MPVISTTVNLSGLCPERNRSIDELTAIFSRVFRHESEILRYNLNEHVKRIERNLYEKTESEMEYACLVAETVQDIQCEISEKYEENKGKMDSTQMATLRDSQAWRLFYTSRLRRAVVNGFIEDVCTIVKVPPEHKCGLRIGVEHIEHFAFKEADNKVDYFSILEKKKIQITSELKELFEENNSGRV